MVYHIFLKPPQEKYWASSIIHGYGLIKLNPCLVSQPSGYEGDFGQKYMNRPAVFPAQASVLLPVDKGSIDSILENQERELKKAKEGDENGC